MRALLALAAGLVMAFLLLPLLAVVPVSFAGSEILALPPSSWSTRWYLEFATDPRWITATRNSFIVGAGAVALAVPMGTAAALGLWLRMRPKLLSMFLLPMTVPAVIAALALYFAFAAVGIGSSLGGLVIAHAVLASPFVVVAVLASLRGIDPVLLRAAESLGAAPFLALLRVIVPLAAPGILAGGVFAFAVSFDEVMVVLFIAGPGQFTLPRQMFSGLRDQITPTVFAAATIVLLVCLGLSWLAARAGVAIGRR
ncbi:MAG: ABC transporter permease [Acetobacteraceae bacterium]|nr:ABC transporter permease [Acetobacteraceae bacterium]